MKKRKKKRIESKKERELKEREKFRSGEKLQ